MSSKQTVMRFRWPHPSSCSEPFFWDVRSERFSPAWDGWPAKEGGGAVGLSLFWEQLGAREWG